MDKKEIILELKNAHRFIIETRKTLKSRPHEESYSEYVSAEYYIKLLGDFIALAEQQLDEPKEPCEVKTVYKTEQITEKHCGDCDGHCECAECEHIDNPYYTYETEVFDYNLCTSCNYRYGVFEPTLNYCPNCGAKITASNGSTTHDNNESENVSS